MRIMPRRKVELSYQEIGRAFIRALFAKNEKRDVFVKEFEERFADFIGVRYALAIPNMRTGIPLFFDSGGFARGDEIIVPSFNYHVVPAILKKRGLRPVFADVDPQTWTIDPSDAQRKITDRTKGLIALHVFGQSCRMEELREVCARRKITLIEDAAHACGGDHQGQRLGRFGDLAFFSFGTGKALVAFGGGMMTTNDEDIFQRIKKRACSLGLPSGLLSAKVFLGSLAETVFTRRTLFSFLVYPALRTMGMLRPGFADRLTEDKVVLEEGDIKMRSVSLSAFQACLALGQLEKLPELNRRRKERAALLTRLLGGIRGIEMQFKDEKDEHTGLYYSIAVPQPERLRRFLFSRGVDTKMGTMRACSALRFFESPQRCPVAERIAPRIVELPCYPSLTEKDIYYQAGLIREFYEEHPDC